MSDYKYWQAAIQITDGKRALTREEQKLLGVHEGDAQLGFFRRKAKDQPMAPVAIWMQGDKIVATVERNSVDPGSVWAWAAPHPIHEAAYRKRMETGKWDDDEEAVTASLAAVGNLTHSPDNNAPEETTDERIARQIEAASASLKDYAKVTSDEAAGRAQSVRSRLLELSGEADKARVAEKEPFLDGGRAVDKKWKPVVDAGKNAADTLRAAIGAWETEKRDAEIKRQREEAKAAAEAALKAGMPPAAEKAPEPPPPPSPVKGAYGRTGSTSVVRVAHIEDQDKVYQFMRDRDELKECLRSLAQRAVKAGVIVPGTSIEEKVDVR